MITAVLRVSLIGKTKDGVREGRGRGGRVMHTNSYGLCLTRPMFRRRDLHSVASHTRPLFVLQCLFVIVHRARL